MQADECDEGFVHDGGYGCEPVLPAEACDDGFMAIPGETTCHRPMECAAGRWGAIPIDAGTVHVDATYTGGDSDGSAAKPFATIAGAYAAAAPGALIAIAAGTYSERIIVSDKPARFWGVCPEQTRVAANGTGTTIISISDAPGTEVVGLSVSGVGNGIGVFASENVRIDRVWVHDNDTVGIFVSGTNGPASAEVSGSLIDRASTSGIVAWGGSVSVASTVVRATRPFTDQTYGRGVTSEAIPGRTADLVVRRSLIADNLEVGALAVGASLTIEGSVIRGTLPQAATGDLGVGVQAISYPEQSFPADLVVSGSLVDNNHYFGIGVGGAPARIERTVVRGTLPAASDNSAGRGVIVQPHPTSGERGVLTMSAALVTNNYATGIHVFGSDASVDRTVVRGTIVGQEPFVFGIGVLHDVTPSSATIRGSLVEENPMIGIEVSGSHADIEGTLVRSTLPNADGVAFGVHFQPDVDGSAASTATITASVIEKSQGFGVALLFADVALDATVIRNTTALDADKIGDGLSAVRFLGTTSARVDHCLIADSARAGISNFGATVSIAESAVRCAAFDLEGEPSAGVPFTFDDRGGNTCGCPAGDRPCEAVSVGLAPPQAFE
jgi:hypothetical protein